MAGQASASDEGRRARVEDISCYRDVRLSAVQWAVLTRTPTGGWAIPIFRRETHTGLRQEGGEFAVLHPIYRRGDPNCCPTGGYRYRRFGWDGARFAVRSEQVLPRIPSGFYR